MNLDHHRGYRPRQTYKKQWRRSPSRAQGSAATLLWNIARSITKIIMLLVGWVFVFFSRHRRGLVPVVTVGAAVALIFFFYILWTLPDPTVIVQRQVVQSTKIYDRTGTNLLYDIHTDFKRTNINPDDLPPYVKEAAIAVEDKDFYRHQGFDLKGIARSIIKNIFSLSKAQGGSTITQQLVKNALLTNQKTYTRKIRELLLSYEIERRFSKDQILKMYLNEIPYGRLAYGIEAASQTYFNKSARDVTLAEAAILAALPQAPSRYSPFGLHKDELIARQRFVLSLMREQGYITPEQEVNAKQETLKFNSKAETIVAPHFVFYIREQLEKEFGLDVIDLGGLKVTTTLDIDKQKKAEEAVDHGTDKFMRFAASNASLVSIDPKTGQILAMVGSRDFFDDSIDGKVNVATRSRQPGSSFKPIVYASAFEKGYTPSTLLYDVLTTFKNIPQDYTPRNYNGKTYGPVTIRQALAGSLNIPAVKTLYLTGVDRVLEFAARLGYTTLTDRSRFSLSLVLGGGEVKLLEHTAAYAAFAQEGVARPPAGILKVEDSDGTVLKEFEDQPKKAFEPQVARLLTSILSDNGARTFIFGAANLLTLPDRPVAAKSGTTNDNRDAWLMGYTPTLATGVWVGNNNNTPMKQGADGSVVAAPIWNEYMRRALEKTPVVAFTPPNPVNTDKPILNGVRPGVAAKVDKASGKLATDRTPASFVEDRIFTELHTILYWLDKDDPQGAQPANPGKDPQFANWENAILAWAKAQTPPLSTDAVPTEPDDLHVPANVPTISVTGITAESRLNTPTVDLIISSSAPRGVRKVYVMVNNSIVTTLIDNPNVQSPISITVNLNAAGPLSSGGHTLSVVAHDDIENAASWSVPFQFE